MVEFKREKKSSIVKSQNKDIEPCSSVIPGYFYAVKMEHTTLESFMVCKVVTSLGEEFQAQKYIKSQDSDSNDVEFIETMISYTLNSDTVIGQLISACVVGSTVLINSVEIEEWLISAISM